MTWLSVLAAWLLCAVLAYGFVFADLQREEPELSEQSYQEDSLCALILELCGPGTLIIAVFIGGAKHGLKFW